MTKKYNEDRFWIFLASGILGILVFLLLLAIGSFYIIIHYSDNKVNKILPQFTYTEETATSELAIIQKLISNPFLSVKSKGSLYKAATEISYMFGNTNLYNDYFAHSVFYLKKLDDKENYVYLVNNYIGLLYANGCYNTAKDILQRIYYNYQLENFSFSLQADYYLTCADIAQIIHEDCTSFLDLANKAITNMPINNDRQLKQAKYDILIARKFITKKDFSTAEAIISKYTEDDSFGFDKNQVYVICDFKIPYYEIMTKLNHHKKNYQQMDYNLTSYLKHCDDYNFRTMKLNLLLYINSDFNDSENNTNKYHNLEEQIANENLLELRKQYGDFLLSDTDTTIEKLTIEYNKRNKIIKTFLIWIIALYLLFAGFCFIRIFLNHVTKDALTQLNNRKKYEAIHKYCEVKKVPYCMLMLDIDDFKKVNDTFGHAAGDEVLRQISEVLRQYNGRGISSYRYGGEELCLVLLRVSEKRTRRIAEEIRETIADPKNDKPCPVTVSIGVGVSLNGEDAFTQADANLYKAKRNGKNQVV